MKMGIAPSGNGFTSPLSDTSPTSPISERRSIPKRRRLTGAGCPRHASVKNIFSRGSGKRLATTWTPQATPLDIPLPYSSANWRDDFEARFEIKEALGLESGRYHFHARQNETQEFVSVEQIDRRRHSLLEEENFGALDTELSVRLDLTASPAVQTIKECHLLRDNYSIVSEPCMGPTLRQQLQNNGPMTETQIAAVVYSVIEMLAFCRKNLIVHGSITPESFRLRNSAFNTAKMGQRGSLPADWIKSVNFTDSSYILDGGFLGTPRDKLTIPSGYCYSNQRPLPLYMAPEVFEHKYSYEADMWSLGVMAYELLTGRFPFWSSSQQALNVCPAGVRAAVRKRQPDLSSPPLRRLSTTCLDFLYQLLDKNPLSRMDFYKALQHPWVYRRVKKVIDPDWGPEYILNKKLT